MGLYPAFPITGTIRRHPTRPFPQEGTVTVCQGRDLRFSQDPLRIRNPWMIPNTHLYY
jgi:hypothetical protein